MLNALGESNSMPAEESMREWHTQQQISGSRGRSSWQEACAGSGQPAAAVDWWLMHAVHGWSRICD